MSQFNIKKDARQELIRRTNAALAEVRDEMDIPADAFLWMVIGSLISSVKELAGWESTRRSIEKSLEQIEEYEAERVRKKLN